MTTILDYFISIIRWTTPIVFLLFLAGVSFTWTNLRGAPWVPSPMAKVHRMLEIAGVGPKDVVYDLGCGDGRTIVAAARRFGARAVGIEIDPLRFIWCQLLITVLGLRSQVRVIFGDLFKLDVSGADVVTCYLLPDTNKKLQVKFIEELRSDARVVSHDFIFPDLKLVGADAEEKLFLYAPQSVRASEPT